jgi:hypothetical protein
MQSDDGSLRIMTPSPDSISLSGLNVSCQPYHDDGPYGVWGSGYKVRQERDVFFFMKSKKSPFASVSAGGLALLLLPVCACAHEHTHSAGARARIMRASVRSCVGVRVQVPYVDVLVRVELRWHVSARQTIVLSSAYVSARQTIVLSSAYVSARQTIVLSSAYVSARQTIVLSKVCRI